MALNIGYCKYCKYRNEQNVCKNNKIDEPDVDKTDNCYLEYSYSEGGWFTVGDFFGCILFEPKDRGL
jgi:hypothetical protein